MRSNPALQNAEIEVKIEYQSPFAGPKSRQNTGNRMRAPTASTAKVTRKIK